MFNIPEIKLSYKIEFAKDFLDKKTVDRDNEPDVLKVTLKGAQSTVTCIETNLMFKLIVVGFSDGSIQSFYFYDECTKDFDIDKPSGPQKSNLQTILDTDLSTVEDTLRECTFLGHSGAVTCLTINYDSYYFISGSTDCTARLWSLKMGQCMAVFKAHARSIWAVKLSPKGFHFATGGADGIIFLWLTNKSKTG